jgi:hypothetical protein
VKTRIVSSLGASVLVAAALTGCGGSKLSHQSIEKLIVSELGNRGYPGATVKCGDVDNKVGKKFTCDVSFTKIDGSVAKNDQINLDKVR